MNKLKLKIKTTYFLKKNVTSGFNLCDLVKNYV